MKKNRIFRAILLVMLTTLALSAEAANRLFHISRSLNANIVCYDANVTGGALNTKEPIHVYWHNNCARPGEEYELTAIQRRMAFGYKVKAASKTEATVALTAYDKRTMKICKRDGKWVALLTINGKECILKEIYVKAKSSISVDWIELRGTAVKGGATMTEKVKA